jgi:UDP-N-acetylmuramate--alanine ligase
MSAIAQYLRWRGFSISGSDRLSDAADVQRTRECLADIGCRLCAQDGSGIGPSTDGVVISTAIENSNPDIARAAECGVPVFHRSEVLAAIVDTRRTIAVAGTSGKSTVTAMIFDFLAQCGKDPSVITGAGLTSLIDKGYVGNAWAGASDLLVIEADESDGSLVRYHPFVTVFLNISKDHKPVDEVIGMFGTLAAQAQHVMRNADDPGLSSLRAERTFGLENGADCGIDNADYQPLLSRMSWRGHAVTLNLPGRYNVANMLAAFCVCDFLGCDPGTLARAAGQYRGISRRFSMRTSPNGVVVVDDYAHNPEKIRAAVSAAQAIAGRVFAIFQPHGFGPTKFMKDELIECFRQVMRAGDALFLLPIYYAGGTAAQDISSADLAKPLTGEITVHAPATRPAMIGMLRSHAKAGDCVLLMGARDPSLAGLAEEILRAV